MVVKPPPPLCDVRPLVRDNLLERHEEDVVAEPAPPRDFQHVPAYLVVQPRGHVAHLLAKPHEPPQAIQLSVETPAPVPGQRGRCPCPRCLVRGPRVIPRGASEVCGELFDERRVFIPAWDAQIELAPAVV